MRKKISVKFFYLIFIFTNNLERKKMQGIILKNKKTQLMKFTDKNINK